MNQIPILSTEDLSYLALQAGLKLGRCRDVVTQPSHEYNVPVYQMDPPTNLIPMYSNYVRKLSKSAVIGLRCKQSTQLMAIEIIVQILNTIIDQGDEDGEGGIRGYIGKYIQAVEMAPPPNKYWSPSDRELMIVSYPSLTEMGELIFEEHFGHLGFSQQSPTPYSIEELYDLFKNKS